ncbi:hypothetical protein VIGAN_02132300 [Vigna angularis var. angularis]|uniref:Uncharacterized protein n=1 Tax=Vigna angularis var. angularis TaxID=157739 RepID=A0A0S3RDP0_PHAAN|nr:hypothetical protein VIGAN_02132300 [Vigna angularis var. angularis]
MKKDVAMVVLGRTSIRQSLICVGNAVWFCRSIPHHHVSVNHGMSHFVKIRSKMTFPFFLQIMELRINAFGDIVLMGVQEGKSEVQEGKPIGVFGGCFASLLGLGP